MLKYASALILTLIVGCTEALPGTDIDTLYAQISQLLDDQAQLQRDVCVLYSEHALQAPDYCPIKQLPPAPVY